MELNNLAEPHHHSGNFRTGGRAAGCQCSIWFTANNLLLHSPTHGLDHIFTDIAGIYEGTQIARLHILALVDSIPVQKISNLLTGNRRTRFIGAGTYRAIPNCSILLYE